VVSRDGDTLYFVSDTGTTIYAASVRGPANQSVLSGMPAIGGGPWTVVPKGIYFVPASDDSALRYFDFKTRQVRQVFKVEKAYSISISPDDRWILYTQVEENNDLMLVEHFR
jgi:Tol biopolymer transport system component